jgi:hypothetical protein
VQIVGEARRAEALAAILAKQAGAAASIKEAAERRRAAEAERLAQLADKQRRKQEAQVRQLRSWGDKAALGVLLDDAMQAGSTTTRCYLVGCTRSTTTAAST